MFSSRARTDTGRLSLGLLIILAVLGFSLSSHDLFPLTLAISFALAAVGADLCSGYAGQPNIGQAFFMGVGAYCTAILTRQEWQLPYLLVLVISAAVGALSAAVVGLAAGRLGHLGFAVITFMLAYVGFTLMGGRLLEGLTNSATGLAVKPATILGIWDLNDSQTLYFFALILLAISVYLSHNYVRSASGRALMTIKENDRVAEVLGIPSYAAKIRVFAFSAALGAVGGSILAEATGYVSPDNFEPITSVLIFGMAAVGGAGTIAGPIIGAFFFRMFPELSQGLEKYSQLVFAVLFLIVLIAFPGGAYVILSSALSGLRKVLQAIPGLGAVWQRTSRITEPARPAAAELVAALPARSRRSRPTRRDKGGEAPGLGETAVSVRGLSARFAGVVALDDVSLTVREGSCHALVGPNGAGKTTLLNCLTGLVPHFDGEIRLGTQTVAGLSPVRVCRLGVGRTFQHPSLVPDLNAVQNVMVGSDALAERSWRRIGTLPRWLTRASHSAGEKAANAALDLVAFPVSRRHLDAANLSYGEQKMVELARVIVGNPKLLLLDEPTSGLAAADVPGVAAMLNRLHRELAITTILVSHDLTFVAELADAMTVLASGTVLADGAPDDVIRQPAVIDVFLGTEQ